MNKLLVILFIDLLLFSTITFSSPPTWQIVPSQSKITFTATQNDAPITGSFKSFSGQIIGDPNDLEHSRIHIVIDTGSVTSSYSELTDALLAPEWFNVKLFPEAVFDGKNFMQTGEKTYRVTGTLTIRDKKVPLDLDFRLDTYTANKAKVTGSANLKRTAFGIGQGEWAKTDEIKDNVAVNFVVMTTRG